MTAPYLLIVGKLGPAFQARSAAERAVDAVLARRTTPGSEGGEVCSLCGAPVLGIVDDEVCGRCSGGGRS